MSISPAARRLLLLAHVVCSVGWIGSIGAFLAVAVSGVVTGSVEGLRAAYISLDWIALFVILPFAAASLITGVAQSLTTSWGLARHYWIIVKIGINVAALALLLLHLGPIHEAARRALLPTFSSTDVPGTQVQFAIQAGAAIAAVLGAVALSIYKPKGVTARGRRFQLERPTPAG